jgi:hypothetical protein
VWRNRDSNCASTGARPESGRGLVVYMAWYMFRLSQVHIRHRRSPFHDTDDVTFAVRVGDQTFPPVTHYLGDVSTGDHGMNLEVGPVEVNDADNVAVSFLVVNSGYDRSDEGYALTFMNTLSNLAAAVLTDLYKAGAVWQELNTGTKDLNALFTANCDGMVAADKYVMTGAELAEQVRNNQPQARDYGGTNSPAGCGGNSDYTVVWDARAVAADYAQGVLANVPNTAGLAGYYSPIDKYQHVIALSSDGWLHETYFKGGGQPIGNDRIKQYPGATAVAGYYSSGDRYQHVIVATSDGQIHEEFFAGGGGASGSDVIANIAGVTALAGYYSPIDQHQHVIAASSDGAIHEILFGGDAPAPEQNVRGHFNGIVGIGAYYAPKDRFEHIIVAQADGTITEIWFGGVAGGGTGAIYNRPGIDGLCAYFSPGDNHQRVIAVDQGSVIHEVWFTGGGAGVGHDVRARLNRVAAVTGYYAASPGDGFEHVVAASGDGTLREMFWTP